MIDIVLKIISFYIENNKKPSVWDLWKIDEKLINNKWSLFVTIYKWWEIYWSKWNIKEIKNSLIEELIENTIEALNEKRTNQILIEDIKKLQIRVDIIVNRQILWKNESIKDIQPTKNWIIVIKKNYDKLAVVLPWISSRLISWVDFIDVLEYKLQEKFVEEDYISYKIETKKETNF